MLYSCYHSYALPHGAWVGMWYMSMAFPGQTYLPFIGVFFQISVLQQINEFDLEKMNIVLFTGHDDSSNRCFIRIYHMTSRLGVE